MLEEIRIRGLGVIEDAELRLGPGLTVLTGETGAGKTMVLTGLALLLGARADSTRVRAGTGGAVVEGSWRVSPNGDAATVATEAGAVLDGDRLLLTRTIGADGRSRSHAGGRAVPLGVLADITADLVAVHGQSDQRRLLQPGWQRVALDRFAGSAVERPLAAYRQDYVRLQALDRSLKELQASAEERAQEAERLSALLAAVETVAPRPGEDVELAALAGRLGHAEELAEWAAAARGALVGSDGGDPSTTDALTLVTAARRALDQAAHHDPVLADAASRLAEISVLLLDVGGDLASYESSVQADPARLAAVQERRARLATLTRSRGETVDDVLQRAALASDRLLELDGGDRRLDGLLAERAALLDRLGRLAGETSSARSAAARLFADAVSGELAGLAMPHARVAVDVRRRPADDGLLVTHGEDVASAGESTRFGYGPSGIDEVELLLTPHLGAPALPLSRGASGGELSRVMLAVEVIFAGADPVPTMVFDEVDAGVGGRAAVEVGRRLARLSRSAQVLVVTHLPHVAAFADVHLAVVKDDDGTVTRSGVHALDDEGRVRELARMLAGAEDSATAAAHARELLLSARSPD